MTQRPTNTTALPEWVVDIVVAKATVGIDDVEQAELDNFLNRCEDREQVKNQLVGIELSAAQVHLASIGELLEPPEAVTERIRHGASSNVDLANFSSRNGTTESDDSSDRVTAGNHSYDPPTTNPSDNSPSDNSPRTTVDRPETFSGRREFYGWLVAAAATVLWLSGWNPVVNDPLQPKQSVNNSPAAQKTNPSNDPSGFNRVNSDPANTLAEFLNEPPQDLIRLSWVSTVQDTSDQLPSGEVLWSDLRQAGFMVFTGLPSNDPNDSQYQLWIFDTDPTQAYPVDGGVFDIAESTDLQPTTSIVPIDAKIRISKAVQFAVTVEKPGGVVVSDRQRLPLIAAR